MNTCPKRSPKPFFGVCQGIGWQTKPNSHHPPILPEGGDPAAMVAALRERVRAHLSAMHNVVGEQDLEMWGENQGRELWRHEVAIFGGRQTVREIKADGTLGRLRSDLPYPKSGGRPGRTG